MITPMAGRPGISGPVRGRAQRGRRAAYDPTSGENWRTGVVVTPEEAVKALKAADLTGLSFAGLVNELIRRMDVDKHGRPVWADQLNQQNPLPNGEDEQDVLPMTG